MSENTCDTAMETLQDAVNTVETVLKDQGKSLDQMRNKIAGHEEQIDKQTKLIAKLQEEKNQMSKEIEMLTKIDGSESDAKQVLINVLRENKLIKDCEEAASERLENALITADEMTTAAVTLYSGFTKIVENDIHGQKNSENVHKSQLKLIKNLYDRVTNEHIGYHADTLSLLLLQEKQRIKLKKRKFKKQHLLSLKHYL